MASQTRICSAPNAACMRLIHPSFSAQSAAQGMLQYHAVLLPEGIPGSTEHAVALTWTAFSQSHAVTAHHAWYLKGTNSSLAYQGQLMMLYRSSLDPVLGSTTP